MQAGQSLMLTTGGGILTGLGCGGMAILVAGRTADHLVETALTVVAAYGSFLVADHLGVSGVLATVSAGLLMGNLGVLKTTEESLLTAQGRDFVLAFWEFAAFIANSIIFLLIGLTVARIPFNGLGLLHPTHHPAGAGRTGGERLSALPPVPVDAMGCSGSGAARIVVGRVAGRAFAWAGARTSAVAGLPQRNHHCRLRRGRILGDGRGADCRHCCER